MWGYIYKTTNLITGKVYIGQHQRARFTTKYKGSGTLIKGAILKYGEHNFKVELLERCKDQQELDLREQYWIDYFHSREPAIGYNQSLGGRENDAKLTHRNDFEAKELREVVNAKDPKIKRRRELNDPNNWVIIYKDGHTREVFKNKLQFYLDKGWVVKEG